MLLFEVWVNGEKQFTVGSEKAEEFGVYLSSTSVGAECFSTLDASGYLENSGEFSDEAKWGKLSLSDGDDVQIKVTSAAEADTPSITAAGFGLVESEGKAMLCSGCGASQFDVSEMLSMSKINLCRECVEGIKVIMADEGGI